MVYRCNKYLKGKFIADTSDFASRTDSPPFVKAVAENHCCAFQPFDELLCFSCYIYFFRAKGWTKGDLTSRNGRKLLSKQGINRR